ncbi:GNAT family N-acetyltransferase [Actinokineospora sp.]|uniref:GNAT family N-acetyltransferase n=1 Tax=Actinokineospora sp. TaxID=1872133 RepID=UPI004037A18F
MNTRDLPTLPTTDPYLLSTVDLDACLTLAGDREWPYEDDKWTFLLRVGQGYGIADPAGGLAAAAILATFGDLAAISMVLVAARYDGRGLGTRLMRHVIEAAGDATITLYATPDGCPLYRKLGFRAVAAADTRVGTFTGTAPGTTRPATSADLPGIIRLDTEVFGADRAHVLCALPAYAERLRVVERDGAITGFAATWRSGRDAEYAIVGPVIAADETDARALIADLAAETDGQVRLDLDDSRPGLAEWAAGHGFEPAFACSIMVHGDRTLPGDRERLFLPFMQALG